MITFLDYSTMKSIAKARNAYWYTLSNGNVRNPATNQQASRVTVLSLSGIGAKNALEF